MPAIRRYGEPRYGQYAGHQVHGGVARTTRVSGPIRQVHVKAGTYRPSNQWRNNQGRGRQILQRSQNFAALLPWLHKYNFARS